MDSEDVSRMDWGDRTTVLETIKQELSRFVTERDWYQFHTPKDVAMSISIEAAELLQLFLWVDENKEAARPPPSRDMIEAEMADIGISLLNLCNRLNVDLASAIRRKLELNRSKYPVERVKGLALKYDEYPEDY